MDGDKTTTSAEPWLHVQGSRHFLDWLSEMRISLAFSTYQTGKVFFVGRRLDMGLAIFERTFNHCMEVLDPDKWNQLTRVRRLDLQIGYPNTALIRATVGDFILVP
jgi:hypothetical protein